MTAITDFQKQVQNNSQRRFGTWHKVDLHNHTPISFDYAYSGDDVETKLIQAIHEKRLSVVMFTDHNKLPDLQFTQRIAKASGATIIRGVEMNIFVEAHGKPDGKVDQDAFYHFLIGFDPNAEQNPEYWLTELKSKCRYEEKIRDGKKIGGLTSRIDDVLDVLEKANAITVPAHLHDQKDPFKGRGIDVVYADKSFLKFARRFTALEVTDEKTAQFFDGLHHETGNLFKNCIQSSDSHKPDDLGRRVTWVKMETPSFDELKAALEMRGRVSLIQPKDRNNWIEAIHIEGNFLKDTWLRFSPECNMFIAVKGSGKTSVLECLRFALDIKPPQSKQSNVNAHLNHILGASGRVRVLINRDDGQPALVERRQNDQYPTLHLSDGTTIQVDRPKVLQFHAQILGWNEIEDAAKDPTTRRRYLDEIAGSEKIDDLDTQIVQMQTQLQGLHNDTHIEFNQFRELRKQVRELEVKQSKLKELSDNNLIDLLSKYTQVSSQYTSLQGTLQALEGGDQRAIQSIQNLYPRANIVPLHEQSPISNALRYGLQLFDSFNNEIDVKSHEIAEVIRQQLESLRIELNKVFLAKQEFDESFDQAKSKLDPEQRQILEKHRQVADETSALPGLKSQLELRIQNLRNKLSELVGLSTSLADSVEKRTLLRQNAVDALSMRLEKESVRLQLRPNQLNRYATLSPTRQSAATQFNRIVMQDGTRVWQRSLSERYFNAQKQEVEKDFYESVEDLFSEKDLHEFISLVQDDDLDIEFEPHKGSGFKPIMNLSAGQRCTAIFPILLNVGSGPLMIDQPEDNLDNRYISEVIAPALVREKFQRQLVFTSHNANLVVLSDCENIVAFDSDGQFGNVINQGFLSTSISPIKEQVLGILDGGIEALRQRILKYGI